MRFLSKLGVDGLVALNTQKDYASFELPQADAALLEHYTARSHPHPSPTRPPPVEHRLCLSRHLCGPGRPPTSEAQQHHSLRAIVRVAAISRYGGGLSGPPILRRSIAQAAAAQQAVLDLRLARSFTVIHVGGLESAADIQASRATGCELRQWYTGLMHGLAQPDPHSLYARVTA